MSVDQPLISIITVVLNGARHIEQTIASVLVQAYSRLDYTVIDGGSTDGTLEILHRYDRSLNVVARPDHGMYFAMNEGIRQSRGEIIGLIHSDDWYEPGAFERVAAEYAGSGRAAIVYGMVRYHDEHGLDMILSYDHSRLPTRMINHPACFVPRSVYDRIGLFDTRYRVAADYELLLRAYRHGVPFRHIEAVLANFRHGGYSARYSSTTEVLRARRQHGYLTSREFLVARAKAVARRAVARFVRI